MPCIPHQYTRLDSLPTVGLCRLMEQDVLQFLICLWQEKPQRFPFRRSRFPSPRSLLPRELSQSRCRYLIYLQHRLFHIRFLHLLC